MCRFSLGVAALALAASGHLPRVPARRERTGLQRRTPNSAANPRSERAIPEPDEASVAKRLAQKLLRLPPSTCVLPTVSNAPPGERSANCSRSLTAAKPAIPHRPSPILPSLLRLAKPNRATCQAAKPRP